MARRRPWLFVFGTGLIIFAVVLIVSLLLIKLLWAWTIPDIFPGAVAGGLIAGTITWWTSFKVAIFISVFAALAGARRKD